MSIHKKNIIIFTLLDIAYIILSANIILAYYLYDNVSWYAYIPFAIILVIGIIGILVYRKESNVLLPITKWQYTLTRVLSLSFLIIYVIQMLIIPDPTAYRPILSIIIGSFLAAIGFVALSLHLSILKKGYKR